MGQAGGRRGQREMMRLYLKYNKRFENLLVNKVFQIYIYVYIHIHIYYIYISSVQYHFNG